MKRLLLAVLIVILMAGTVACSKSSESTTRIAPTTAPVPAPASLKITSGISSSKPATVTQVPAPTIAVPPAAPGINQADTSSYGGVAQTAISDRMVIRTANMYLVVGDVAKTIEQITQLAATYNGFVVSSNSWKEQERMMGNIAIRVEVGNFDNAMKALRGMAVEVRSESTTGQDVTEEYTDLDAQLRNLQAAETQLLKLMEEKTEKVTDILEVQRELVKTRGEIEQTKGRMQYLEKSSAMSLIQINLEQSKLTVEFNASSRNVKAGQDVRYFPNVSGGFTPYSYKWDFGDGATSTDEQPSHAYKSDGSYTVSLMVTDDRGGTANYERKDYITVLLGWKAGNTATSAWNGLVGFGHFLANLLIWIGYFSPLWIVILVILYFAWWRRRKKAKK